VVVRTAPALLDPNPLWTELGELEHERGRPEAGLLDWKNILSRDPNNPERISELATLLWDYNHMAEALAVVEEGRKRIARPRFFAFETGVLREEVKDATGRWTNTWPRCGRRAATAATSRATSARCAAWPSSWAASAC
jgi:hypothetical protein